MNLTLISMTVGSVLTLAAANLPDMTEYGNFEAWTRFGVAGLSLLAIIIVATVTQPRREREHDKAMSENISAILRSSEERIQIVMHSTEKANDKVCDRLDDLKRAVELGNVEQQSLLRSTLVELLGQKEQG